MSDLAARLDQAEQILQEGNGGPGEDIVLRVEYFDTVLDPITDERHEVHLQADYYEEGEWSDAGNGRRMRVRWAKFNKLGERGAIATDPATSDVPKTPCGEQQECSDGKGLESGESTVPES